MDPIKTILTEVPKTQRYYQTHQKWDFNKGDVREAFERVFSPEKDYVLFQTIANKEAVEALEGYVGFRKDMGSPWVVRKIRKGDDPVYVPGASDVCNGLMFDNSLMDSYRCAIDKTAKRLIGRENFSHYPLVSTRGVHYNDRDQKAIFWPQVYIVNAKKHGLLKDIINGLSSADGLEVLRDLQSPQFYQMAEIETLHRLRVAPIVQLPKELKVGAKDLASYVDFLAQMTESYQWTGPVIDAD
ncbi:hypothetical protein J4423_01170 [Candidatus Pacearchaeota archaeon]|nr:hypothetical protein [Candidatus Pacearchaeota archaeon]